MFKKVLVALMISVLSISCVACKDDPVANAVVDAIPGANTEENKREDSKNADELAATLQTCITDYDCENEKSLGDKYDSITLTWGENGVEGQAPDGFLEIVSNTIYTPTQSKVDGTYASAEITYDKETKMYTIEVKLGDAATTK